MEFPLIGVIATNSSERAVNHNDSLYSRAPYIAATYIGILGVAAVVGTFGNLVVVITVIIKYFLGQRHKAKTTNNDAGRAVIANLAMSDMIVTAVINPLAIAGQ